MTDADTTAEELAELREAVTDLRKRVSVLEGRLGSDSGENAESGAYDRYDRAVLEQLGDITEERPQRVKQAYGEAGIYDSAKQKQRAKRLHRLETEDSK